MNASGNGSLVAASSSGSGFRSLQSHDARLYAVSWFVQQAVEKGLKALYIERFGALAPRIHDLEELGDLLHVPAAVDVDLSLINPTFDEVRYPDMSSGLAPVDAFTETRTTQHLTAADRIMSWLNEQFNPPSTQP